MFSMCSELTPRAPIPDTRIPQLMQPWAYMQLQEGSKEVIEGCPTRLINVSPHLSHKKWPNSINMVQVVLALMLEFFKLSLSYFFLSKLSFTFSQVGWTNSLQLAVKWLVNSLSPVHFAKLQLNKRKTSSNMLSLGLITRFSFWREKMPKHCSLLAV